MIQLQQTQHIRISASLCQLTYLGITITNISLVKHIKCLVYFAVHLVSLQISLLRNCYTCLRSQITYGSPIWRPSLIKDIKFIEQIQRRATKFILNDYHSDYYNRLIKLQILPLMYMFELAI